MDVNLFPTVASIMAICFLVGLFCKNRKLDTWIPCIVGTVGGILGVVGLFVIPDFPAGNVMDAIAVGIVSGLSATGAHQIFKQIAGRNEAPLPDDVNYTWSNTKPIKAGLRLWRTRIKPQMDSRECFVGCDGRCEDCPLSRIYTGGENNNDTD